MKSDNIRLPTRNEWFTHLKYNKASACPETFNCNDGPRECRDQNILFCSFSRLQSSASRTTRNTMNVSQLLIGWEGFLQDFLFFPVWKQTANICFHLHQRRTVLFHSVQFHLGLKKETKKQHYHVAFLVFLTAKKKRLESDNTTRNVHMLLSLFTPKPLLSSSLLLWYLVNVTARPKFLKASVHHPPHKSRDESYMSHPKDGRLRLRHAPSQVGSDIRHWQILCRRGGWCRRERKVRSCFMKT